MEVCHQVFIAYNLSTGILSYTFTSIVIFCLQKKSDPRIAFLQLRHVFKVALSFTYGGADKSLARPNSRCILFDGENISFDASLVMYINSTNIPPIMIINRLYEHQNVLSL